MKEVVMSLLIWYQKNKRDLPWRKDKNPYHVWLSEIMLQQTRIEAVIDYYYRFLKELPTITDLADCDSEKLNKLWEGLGYYTRVRNLQKAAQIIRTEFDGVFPNNYQDILTLPGIGEYTASAISSICFSEKQATVDGNVLRVYTRINNDFSNIDNPKVRRNIRENLMKYLPEDSGSFNQAIMELGETICIANGIPKCEKCPLQKFCQAYKKQNYELLPVRNPKKIQNEEKYTVFLFYNQNKVWISKRTQSGLLHNLWEFPNIPGHLTKTKVQDFLKKQHISIKKIESSVSYQHIFSHKKWNMISYLIEVKGPISINQALAVSIDKLNFQYAIPTAFQPFKKIIEGVIQNDEA